MGAHIIGRPDDGLLDILLGDGADPEQALIGGRVQAPQKGDGSGAYERRPPPQLDVRRPDEIAGTAAAPDQAGTRYPET